MPPSRAVGAEGHWFLQQPSVCVHQMRKTQLELSGDNLPYTVNSTLASCECGESNLNTHATLTSTCSCFLGVAPTGIALRGDPLQHCQKW